MKIKINDIVFLVFIYLISITTQICTVDGLSMYPTLDNKDVLVLWKTQRVDYGDIIVLHNEDSLLVKRVIAKEGDNIMVDGSTTKVNDVVIQEAYAYYDSSSNALSSINCELPKDTVFVMGDNRKESFDSRKIGPINEDLIVGKVILDVTALTGMSDFQFKMFLRVVSGICIILLGRSLIASKLSRAKRRADALGRMCDTRVEVVKEGDIGASISDIVKHD